MRDPGGINDQSSFTVRQQGFVNPQAQEINVHKRHQSQEVSQLFRRKKDESISVVLLFASCV